MPEVYSLGYRFSFAEGRGPDEVLTAFGVDSATIDKAITVGRVVTGALG